MTDSDTPIAALLAEASAAVVELTDALDALADHFVQQEREVAEMEKRISALEAEQLRPGVVPRAWLAVATHDAPAQQ